MAKRLFIALDLPETVARALAALDPQITGLRWLPARSLHLTLAFLGNVETETARALSQALGSVESPSFPLSLRGLGRFGGRGRPVVIAYVEEPPPELLQLHAKIRETGAATGIDTDSKPFRPHVTLARGQHCPAGSLREFLTHHTGTPFGRMDVTGFSLYSSVLTPAGAEYTREIHQDLIPAQSPAAARCRET